MQKDTSKLESLLTSSDDNMSLLGIKLLMQKLIDGEKISDLLKHDFRKIVFLGYGRHMYLHNHTENWHMFSIDCYDSGFEHHRLFYDGRNDLYTLKQNGILIDSDNLFEYFLNVINEL